MSTTYTEHYSFGKQENYADLFSMEVITDNWDSLDAILYGFSTGKQDKLSATNKLSVAFVDFTPAQIAALGSGITDDDVEQIDLNKNNIYYIEKANGKKNLVPIFGRIENGGCVYTYSNGQVTVTGTKSGALSIATLIDNENLSAYGLSAGDQIVLVSDNANIGTVVIFEDSQGTQDAAISAYNETKTVTIPSGRTKWYLRLQVKPATTGTINETAKPMVCDKKLYDIDPTVTPCALSNVELTAKEQANEKNILLNRHYGVKNIFVPTAGTVNNATGFTGTITRNADNSYTINGSTGGSVYYLMLGKISMPVGTFVLYARPGDKTGISVYNDGDWIDSGNDRYKTFSQPTSQNIFLRIAANQTIENYTIYPMICDRTAWNTSRDYEIGALSNAELTKEINSAPKVVYTNALLVSTSTTIAATGLEYTIPGTSTATYRISAVASYNASQPDEIRLVNKGTGALYGVAVRNAIASNASVAVTGYVATGSNIPVEVQAKYTEASNNYIRLIVEMIPN